MVEHHQREETERDPSVIRIGIDDVADDPLATITGERRLNLCAGGFEHCRGNPRDDQRDSIASLILREVRKETAAREHKAEHRQANDVPDAAALGHERPFGKLAFPQVHLQHIEKAAIRIRREHTGMKCRGDRALILDRRHLVQDGMQDPSGTLQNEKQRDDENGSVVVAIQRHQHPASEREYLQNVTAIDQTMNEPDAKQHD
jgi:hypothetical protein